MSSTPSEVFRISPQQERIWTLQSGGGGQEAYHSRCTVLIEGPLDSAILSRAWEVLVERHQLLRTSLLLFPGLKRPVQAANGSSPRWLDPADLGSAPEAEQQVRLDELFEELGRQRFDFAAGPTACLRLVRLSDDRRVLMISLPAHLSDAVGLGNLVRDLAECYGALCNGTDWEDEPLQYVALAEWLGDLFESVEAEPGKRYWGRSDFSALPGMRLPGGLQASSEGLSPGLVKVDLSAELTARLAGVAERSGAGLRDVLLAAWYHLLGRLTGQPEVIVGVACDGRTDEDLKRALGPLARYLPVACRPEPGLSFAAFVQTVAGAVAEAEQWQECFDWSLVTPGLSSILPFGFDWQEPVETVRLNGLSFAMVRRFACLDRFEVRLGGSVQGETLALELHFDESRVSREDAGRLLERLGALLDGVIAAPDRQSPELADLDIVGPAERRWLVAGCNSWAADLALHKGLHELFEEQAQRTPGRPALAYEGEVLTYADLNVRANRLAHALRRQGVGPESLVGICLERSADMVIALLGTLKAGGAYLPLDPDYPEERLSFMLHDAGPKVLVTREGVRDDLRRSVPAVIDLRMDAESLLWESAADPAPLTTSENLAYVIYTSGSTGRPKGVMIRHRSIVNRVLWLVREFPLADDRLLHKTPFSFDASIWEIFAPLFSGALLVVARPGGHQDSAYMVSTIAREEITVLQLVPSFLRVLLDEPGIAACSSLRRVFCGGEALSSDLVQRFHETLPGADLTNLYGPTEIAIDATFWRCGRGPQPEIIPIGRPIANAEAHVLDARGRLVPAGAPGELYVGGPGLARGYLARPDLSAEKFVPHFSSAEPGARLYRTGDLVRRRPDGAIEYLGRIDHQVKLRGFRIELGEIETCLRQQPGVRESVVIARGDGQGGQRLVAYVVCDSTAPEQPAPETAPENAAAEPAADGDPWWFAELFGDGAAGEEAAPPAPAAPEVTPEGLREALTTQLPEYMVPSAFVLLDVLPRTPSGKIDRAALPEPEWTRSAKTAYEAPRTPLERSLHGIWKELLGAAELGIHDDFFALGGHSLLAAQLVARVRSDLGRELALRTLFAAPTVAGLATQLEEQGLSGEHAQLPPQVPLVAIPRDGELPLSFGQERLWFLYEMAPESGLFNVTLGYRLHGPVDRAALEWSFNEIVRRHEALRTSFATVQGKPLQFIAPSLFLPLPVIDLRGLGPDAATAEAERLARLQTDLAFDLTRAPLMRTYLLQVGDADWVVLGIVHHIIFDGWSVGILQRELEALYNGRVTGQPVTLPELRFQYADFAYWQRRWLTPEVLEPLREFWVRLLADPPVLDTPADRPRPSQQTGYAASRSGKLPSAVFRRLGELTQLEGATMFMTLGAALSAQLSRYTGQTDLTVGSPIANRRLAETHGMLGFFVNTIVLRSDLSGDPSFQELVGRVREVAMGIFAHEDLPFEKLVEALQPERHLSRSPLFQVLFVHQNAPRNLTPLHGLQVAPLDLAAETTQIDVSLATAERVDGSLAITFTLSLDLFEPETAQRFLRHFQTLLTAVAEDPGLRVSELPLLDNAERSQVLFDWNAESEATTSTRATFLDLFLARVAEDPDRTAVVFQGEALTYGEVDWHARAVAARLRAAGVGREDVVALCTGRGPAMVVGMLGIFRAGGVYMPLDPDYPEARLEVLLEDSRARAALVTLPLADRLMGTGIPLVLVGPGADSTDPEPAGPVAIDPDQAAYLIYTSGSTGRPKGVVVPHRGIPQLAELIQSRLGVGPGDRVLQFSSPSFDASLWDVWTALGSGATLVTAPAERLVPGPGMLNLLREQRVTHMSMPPSVLSRLPAEATAELTDLRSIVVGAEVCPPELARQWVGSRRFFNAYGLTETTINASLVEVTGNELRVPIGRPQPGFSAYVLDAQASPVPVGIKGELYLGGANLARGYQGLPGQTAERFVPDPFSRCPGGRLYRTGDLARWTPEGLLEILGRVDRQVKIRGFRVEPEEIETVLAQHPDLRQVAVVVRTGPGDSRSLVAYYVADPASGLTAGQLRDYLQGRLPEYLVPSLWVAMDRIPLLPSGKVDRRSLLSAEPAEQTETPAVMPRSSLELQLTQIWEEVLGVRPIRITDNFFDLGGHSLLAVSIVWQVQERFGVEIQLSTLFQKPTVEQLARALRESGEQLRFSPLVAMQMEGTKRPFFCVHSIGGNVMRFYDLARRMAPDRPFYGLQAPDPTEAQSFPSMEEMAAQYIEAVRSIQPAGPYLLGGYSYGSVVSFEMARQLQARGEQVALLGLIDGGAPAPESFYDKVTDVDILLGFARDMVRAAGADLPLPARDFKHLDDDAALDLIVSRLREARLVPADMESGWVRRFLRGIKGRIEAMRSYKPERYSGTITLFRSTEEESDTAAAWREAGLMDDTGRGWEMFTTRPLDIQPIPGYHVTIVNEPHVAVLAEKLRASIDVAEAANS